MLWWFACGLVVAVLYQKRTAERETTERFLELWTRNVCGHLEARDALMSAMRTNGQLHVAIQGPAGVGKSVIADVLRATLEGSAVVEDAASLPGVAIPRLIVTGRNFTDVPKDWTLVTLGRLKDPDLRNLVAAYAWKNVSRTIARTLFEDHERAWRGRVDFDESLSDHLVQLIRESEDHAHELARFRFDVESAVSVLLNVFGQHRCKNTVDDALCFVSIVASLQRNQDDLPTISYRILLR